MEGGEMTDEQINIAIAEACGWHCNQFGLWGIDFADGVSGSPPNYCNDLNACHELEKMLDDKQLARYAQQIIGSARRKMNIPDHESHYPIPFIISATARQRCEAYLKTIGKWIE
jgi:hypothetical protein